MPIDPPVATPPGCPQLGAGFHLRAEDREQGTQQTKKDTGAEEKQGGPERRLGDRQPLARTLKVATDNTYPDNLARTIT